MIEVVALKQRGKADADHLVDPAQMQCALVVFLRSDYRIEKDLKMALLAGFQTLEFLRIETGEDGCVFVAIAEAVVESFDKGAGVARCAVEGEFTQEPLNFVTISGSEVCEVSRRWGNGLGGAVFHRVRSKLIENLGRLDRKVRWG